MAEIIGLDNELTEKKEQRTPFYVWCVGGHDYRLKLDGNAITLLEQKFAKNLFDVIEDFPPLTVMLTIIQAAAQRYEHGITFEKCKAIYDQYIDEGGTQARLYAEVIFGIYSASGFFTEKQAAAVEMVKADALSE